MNAPAYVYMEPNTSTQWKATIYVPQTKSPNQELCNAKLVSFTHPDANLNSLPPKPTFSFKRSRDSAGDYRQGVLLVNWTPTDNHVDLNGHPYTATIRAYADDKGDGCNGDTWAEELEMTVPVYVIKGSPDATANDDVLNFQGDFSVIDTVSYDIRPELVIGARISASGLQSADLKAIADLSFSNKLTITANGAGTLIQRVPVLAEKSFIKVFITPSGVPIVASGKFKVDAEITGHVNGKATLEKLLELNFPDTTFGLQYRNGVWKVVKSYTPSYTFQIKGEADASADLTLTLIPDLQISFYDAATGRLIVEPYVYAQAGLHGQFNYLLDNGGAPLTDLDYWFTDLQAGAGANLKLYAGLSIFDYTLASYPSGAVIGNIDTFEQVTLWKKTPMAKLPTLTVAVDYQPTLTDNSDSRLIYLQGDVKNYADPLFNIGLIQFANWTQPNLLTTATGATLTAASNPGGYWFKYHNKGIYKVRLAATTNLGAYVRQVDETTLRLTDTDKDGMVDQWEVRFGVADSNADDDQDGFSNLEEFNSGTQPNNANSFPFTLTGTTGDKQVTLQWPAVTDASNYSICSATADIVDININNCLNYADGAWQDTTATTLKADALINGTKYYFRVLAENATDTLRVSNLFTAIPNKLTLNDTGISAAQCYQRNATFLVACTSAAAKALSNTQDGMVGRDVTAYNNSDGHAGFSFTKISASGAALSATASSWACV